METILNYFASFLTPSMIVFMMGLCATRVFSFVIVRDLSHVVECFNIKLNDKDKKLFRKFLNTIFIVFFVIFVFFLSLVRLSGLGQ